MKTGTKKDKVGIQDIARVLNISASTVSRALNDHPRISTETKVRVKQTAARLGYSQGFAETVNLQKSDAIAVMVPMLNNNFYRAVCDGITSFFKENGFYTFVVNTQNDNEYKVDFYKNFRKYGISGIVEIISDKNTLPDDFENIKKEALPFVTVCEPEENSGFSSVLPDMFQGVQKITGYLQSLKTCKIDLFLEEKNRPEDYYLESSMKTAISSSKNKAELTVHYPATGGGNFAKEVETVLKRKNSPEVLLVKNIYRALEVQAIASRMGIGIPAGLLLIAVDTDYKTGNLTSNLSLLKLPAYEMGYEAGKLLFHQIKNFDTEKKLSVIPSEFILKNSAIRIN